MTYIPEWAEHAARAILRAGKQPVVYTQQVNDPEITPPSDVRLPALPTLNELLDVEFGPCPPSCHADGGLDCEHHRG